jgi:transcriptional regulator with XRE-family HTH domain
MQKKALRKPGKNIIATLAANLRGLRAKKKISQKDLAEICGMNRTYVGSVERGERNVTLSSLEVLAKALGVSVPKLLTPRAHDDESAN